jgi:hypothetical protein
MIFDKTLLLSDAQAITAGAPSDNTIDLGATGRAMFAAADLVRDVGKGIPLLIQVVEDFDAAGAATLTIFLQTDSDDSFASPKTVAVTPALDLATLKAGYQVNFDYIPRGVDERYMRLSYSVLTGPMTAGKITAGVTMGNQTNG